MFELIAGQTTGLRDLYPRIVDEYKFRPTDGLLLSVLKNAGRLGDPKMAITALGHLRAPSTLPFKVEEHHMAPLIEAFCRGGQLVKAIDTIHSMRSNGVPPVQSTAGPITEAITLGYREEKPTEEEQLASLEEAYGLITSLYSADPKSVDPVVINALLSASVKLNDYHRALTTYKDMTEFTPDIHTYNILLQGCINLRLRSLGDSLLLELKELKLQPDITTYERLIELCVVSDSGDWKDGLGYLESLTNYGMSAGLNVYVAVATRLGWEGEHVELADLLAQVQRQYGRTGENTVKRAAVLGEKDRARAQEE